MLSGVSCDVTLSLNTARDRHWLHLLYFSFTSIYCCDTSFVTNVGSVKHVVSDQCTELFVSFSLSQSEMNMECCYELDKYISKMYTGKEKPLETSFGA